MNSFDSAASMVPMLMFARMSGMSASSCFV